MLKCDKRMEEDSFSYSSERFGDIQMLRYRLDGFNDLTLKQKLYIYCLAKATLWGRDITFHQFGKYNLQRLPSQNTTVVISFKISIFALVNTTPIIFKHVNKML